MSADANVRTLVIDGEDISARPDQTILEAAREHNISIPDAVPHRRADLRSARAACVSSR